MNLLNIFRDQVWQSVGAIAGIISLLLYIFIEWPRIKERWSGSRFSTVNVLVVLSLLFAILYWVSSPGNASLWFAFIAGVCMLAAGRMVAGKSRWWVIGVGVIYCLMAAYGLIARPAAQTDRLPHAVIVTESPTGIVQTMSTPVPEPLSTQKTVQDTIVRPLVINPHAIDESDEIPLLPVPVEIPNGETRWIMSLPPDTGWRMTINQNQTEILASWTMITRPIWIYLVMETGWIRNQKQPVGDEIGQVNLGFSSGKQSQVPLRLSMLQERSDIDFFVVEIPREYRNFALISAKIVVTGYPTAVSRDFASRLKKIVVLALK